ncbi:MAG: xanthine dehydrogenase family protein molybdopterin-binding subunit [Chloroflexota bacterium]|nr:xanthine dehydrogenase family protein molybdopterin-binding subunit [Chloroflexota bacterium]
MVAKSEPNIVLSNQKFNVVGSRPIRHDGADKVTGRARYSADIHLPGMLYGKVLRSPHAHARIKDIKTNKAKLLPGVKAIVTSADLPQPTGVLTDIGESAMINPKFLSNNCLASDKVLYKGHAVAAVAATNVHIAEQAMALIEVDYEVLPSVTDLLDAMEEDAPVLHERLANVANPNIRPGGLRDESDGTRSTNVANHFFFEAGDIEQGFEDADIVIEREFRTSSVHQGYIEPHSATADWGPDNSLTIWCSSQGHFNVRDQVAVTLGIDVSNIRVVPMEIGGGFGGKTLVYLEPVAALLSRLAGLPVKLSMNRSEVFQGSGPTSGSWMRCKLGVRKDGRITALDASLAFEAGAYPGSPINPGCQCMSGPYDISNGRIEGFDVVLNKPKTAAYRAPGAPAAAFAMETVVDEICERIGMDPLDFRVLNASKEGSRRLTGPLFGSIGNLDTVQAAMDHPHWNTPLEGTNRGRGVASGYWFNATGPASATASVNSDGTVSLIEGSPDIGGSRAAVSMQLAEVLGIAAEDVRPVIGDTDSVGYTSLTGGSSVAFKTGWACYEAAIDIKQQMLERAARIWDVDSSLVEYSDGTLSHTSDPELKITFKEMAARLNSTGGPITGRGNVSPTGVGGSFATHIVDVEVDPETGKIDILRYTAVQDVGKAVHPSYVEGQIQGGSAQGIGWALNEEYIFDEKGSMENPTFLDYRMPTSLDLPMIDTVLVEVANPGHPYGVRGVGEVPIVPPMAAIANAVYAAIGIRMERLPMSPANVLSALWKREANTV